MTKRIFRSIIFIAIATLLTSFIVVMGVMYRYFNDLRLKQLILELDFISHAVENEGISYFDSFLGDDIRVTWISEDGTVVYDSLAKIDSMENHADREEIQEAFVYGVGESSRYSLTRMEKTLYQAKRLSDGSVLRVSVSVATVNALLVMALKPVTLIFIVILVISFILARNVSRRIVNPLNKLDLDKPLENDVYDEITPMLSYIEKQKKEIDDQSVELKNRKKEFYTIIENMEEGLILLNSKGTILSINEAAIDFLQTKEECVGTDFLILERNHEIASAMRSAKESGHSEILISKLGREYQINISYIKNNKNSTGFVLLIMDISDKVFAERNRREFTANVTHELKTPLHSIMGSAELLENGLVKPEDTKMFTSRIRTEAIRLISLIEDIIRLSQLDEGVGLVEETVDLYELAKEEITKLSDVALQKQVSLAIEGSSTVIVGVKQLLHEIIYNLCVNAIKYNVVGGKINVLIGQQENRIFLSVEDTGIGIPQEHLDRVFERFYRVDKSHSKETGGTGLGLSIVKHAALYMNGEIDIESEVGKGTKITIFFNSTNE